MLQPAQRVVSVRHSPSSRVDGFRPRHAVFNVVVDLRQSSAVACAGAILRLMDTGAEVPSLKDNHFGNPPLLVVRGAGPFKRGVRPVAVRRRRQHMESTAGHNPINRLHLVPMVVL